MLGLSQTFPLTLPMQTDPLQDVWVFVKLLQPVLEDPSPMRDEGVVVGGIGHPEHRCEAPASTPPLS